MSFSAVAVAQSAGAPKRYTAHAKQMQQRRGHSVPPAQQTRSNQRNRSSWSMPRGQAPVRSQQGATQRQATGQGATQRPGAAQQQAAGRQAAGQQGRAGQAGGQQTRYSGGTYYNNGRYRGSHQGGRYYPSARTGQGTSAGTQQGYPAAGRQQQPYPQPQAGTSYGWGKQGYQNGYYQNGYPAGQQQGPVADPNADQPAEDAEPEPPFFDAMLGTQVPLSIGPMLSLETPGRLLLQGELGWMPRAYGAMIDGLLQNFPAYDGPVARVVNATLSDALVLRASAGWRPFPSAGFEITGGYTYLSLGGDATGDDLADLVGGDFADQFGPQLANTTVTVDTSLHNIHIGLGWRFTALEEHLVIRVSVAYMQTLAASTSVTVSEQPAIQAAAQQAADQQLNPIFVDNVKLPVAGLNAGYRF